MNHASPHSELSTADYTAVLGRLPELYVLQDLSVLPNSMLTIVRALIPNLFCSYNELSHEPRNVVLTCLPGDWRDRMEPYMAEGSKHLDGHPLYTHFLRAPELVPRSISDYLSEEEWRQTGFFTTMMGKVGALDTMIFLLKTSRQALIFIGINRAEWGFSERDRQVARLLQSHFSAAYENAIAFTNAQALALVAHPDGDLNRSGVVVIDPKGQILHTNERALHLIRKYFKGDIWGAALPPMVANWLSRDGSMGLPVSVLEEIIGDNRLSIRWTLQSNGSRILLLQEQSAATGAESISSAGLSPREAEVLHWIAEGKSNPEIGKILSISGRTVEKHVETVYKKLGVENRMGAVLRVLSSQSRALR